MKLEKTLGSVQPGTTVRSGMDSRKLGSAEKWLEGGINEISLPIDICQIFSSDRLFGDHPSYCIHSNVLEKYLNLWRPLTNIVKLFSPERRLHLLDHIRVYRAVQKSGTTSPVRGALPCHQSGSFGSREGSIPHELTSNEVAHKPLELFK